MGLLGCGVPRPDAPAEVRVHQAAGPSERERFCAWFGDRDEEVLYFGASAFWSQLRVSGGDPRADLRVAGPQWVGRFDLSQERFLEPLVVATDERPGGVWDVLVHPAGRLFFTTYFDEAGYVELESGRVVRLPELGPGLNELALGPDGSVLVTRYGYGLASRGSVLVLDAEGRALAEHPLESPPGTRVAPKSVAWDPVRREIWVNADLLPGEPGQAEGEIRTDTRVLSWDGAELLRFEVPEVQFMAFGPDGTGYFAERAGDALTLRIREPKAARMRLLGGRRVGLDPDFPSATDFVQELRVSDGLAVLTRWSGRVHLVSREGRVRDVVLPRADDHRDGLYYTGILREGRLCATLCSGVAVACRDLSP